MKDVRDTWLFRDKIWRRFDTDGRDDHGMAHHRVARRMILLEGVAVAGGLWF
jgi:hypothetical protein